MGMSVEGFEEQVTVTCDTSQMSWVVFVNDRVVQGVWSQSQSLLHINFLEMEAVLMTLKYCLPVLKNKQVFIRLDNASVVQYINKQGTQDLASLVKRIWQFALCHNMK